MSYVISLGETTHKISKLFTPPNGNTKLRKSQGKYFVIGLSLAPHNSSGYNVCPFATRGCKSSCIYYSGYARVYGNIYKSRIAKNGQNAYAVSGDIGSTVRETHPELDIDKKCAKCGKINCSHKNSSNSEVL